MRVRHLLPIQSSDEADNTLEDICGNNLNSAFDTRNGSELAKSNQKAYTIGIGLE